MTVQVQKFGVIGDPVSQSLSPVIHEGWMRDHGLCASYEAIRVTASAFGPDVAGLWSAGYRGLNVTAPHKREAARLCERVGETAGRVEAVNTLLRTDTGWRGENTDVEGFWIAAERARDRFDIPPPQHVVLIGAGGAAPAAVLWSVSHQARLTIVNRTPARAAQLLERLDDHHEGEAVGAEFFADAVAQADIVVHASAAGHQGQAPDWPDGDGRLLIDMSYGKAADVVLDPAAQRGWCTQDGLEMLVAQARAAFALWFGVAPDLEAGLERARGGMAR